MKTVPAILLAIVLSGCAQMREPVGGPQDTAPPELLSADPANGTVLFDADRILLRFNERIKLERVSERLLISPPLDVPPEVAVVGGQDVMITLKAPLRPNATYTFNLGEAVVDLTENNPAAGLTYVVSTGPVLDSLFVQGTVSDAFTDKPEENILVVLHADTDSTGFSNGRPAYFTRTKKDGTYLLQNLRSGRYGMHALRDQNANYRYDLPNEAIAFVDSSISTDHTGPYPLRVFVGAAPVQQVREAVVLPDRCWRVTLARPTDTLRLAATTRVGGKLDWSQEWNTQRDTVLLWPSDTTLLTGESFAVSDSSGVIDTLTYRPQRKMPFNTSVVVQGQQPDGGWWLHATRPLKEVQVDRFQLTVDSAAVPVDATIDQRVERRLVLSTPVPTTGSAILTLLPGAVRDIYGARNDTTRLVLSARAERSTGELIVRMVNDTLHPLEGHFVLQVLNAQGAVVRSFELDSLNAVLPAMRLLPGVYSLKLIEDRVPDGRWTTGDLQRKRQPERVFRMAGEVTVRAGWEVVADWPLTDGKR